MRQFLLDVFSGPDGKTIAIGRVFSVPVLMAGLLAVVHATFAQPPQSMTEMGLGLMGSATAFLVMVKGNNSVDNAPS